MKPEDFVKFKFPTTPVLSPDGSTVIFPIKVIDEKKNSYKSALYKKILTKDGYEVFTEGKNLNSSPKWSSDGKFIAFLSTRSGSNQLYVISNSGGEAFPVTEFEAPVVDFEWNSDNSAFLVIADVSQEDINSIVSPQKKPSFVLEPEEFEVHESKKKTKKELRTDPRVITEAYYREGTNYRDGKFRQPFIVTFVVPDNENVEGYSKKQNPKYIGEFGYYYSIGPFSKDNRSVYVSRKLDPAITRSAELVEIDIEEKKISILYEQEEMELLSNISISPNGESLIYSGVRKNPELKVYDNNQIFYFSLKNKQTPPVVLTTDYKWSASYPKWYSNEIVLFLSNHEAKTTIESINIQNASITTLLDKEFMIYNYSACASNQTIVYERSKYDELLDLVAFNVENKTEKILTNTNKYFKEQPTLGKLISVPFTREGVNFQGWLVLPQDYDQKTKVPVVLEIHGGPAAMWSPHEKSMWFEFQLLVSAGYAVFYCNPRGSDGYGIDFRSVVFQNWGDLAGKDILAGLEKALINYTKLDRENVFVTGGSYGGYMTSWLITHFDLFKGAVSQRGVYDYTAFAQTTDIPLWFEDGYGFELIDPERNSIYERDSPAFHIKNLNCPLLIIHSENDFRVPIVSAEQLFWLGKRYKKIVEFVRYPRDGHELSRSGEPRHIIDRLNRIVDWFNKYKD